MLTLGCHLSASKGYLSMGKEALTIGANTFQFFTRNPRGGKAKSVDEEDIREYSAFSEEHEIGVILAHAPYTLNLASDDESKREFAVNTMKSDLDTLEKLPQVMYNFHPGNHMKQGVGRGIELITEGLNKIIIPEQRTVVLLETMAGKGTEIGRRFEELREIIDNVKCRERLGVCLDTCHVSDAGYNLVHDLDGVLKEFDDKIGMDYLKALHLNDSKNQPNSHKDRHEKIGVGFLGADTFRQIVSNEKLHDLPMYLETPNDLNGYAVEISQLREFESQKK